MPFRFPRVADERTSPRLFPHDKSSTAGSKPVEARQADKEQERLSSKINSKELLQTSGVEYPQGGATNQRFHLFRFAVSHYFADRKMESFSLYFYYLDKMGKLADGPPLW
jgi:hypothetical protein